MRRTWGRATLIGLILTTLFACATGMNMTSEDVQTLQPEEGLILGSVLIRGGSDILGRTGWEILAQEAGGGMLSFNRQYSVKASRNGDEVVFLTKMPAGRYHFLKLVQPGFSSFEGIIDVLFEVHARRTLYIGRLVIEFPPGLISVDTDLGLQVEDAKQSSVDRVKKDHGVALSEVVTDLMIDLVELYSSCVRVETPNFESKGANDPSQSAHIVCTVVVDTCREEPAGTLCTKLLREYGARTL